MAPQTQTEQTDRSVDPPFVLGQEMVQVDDKVYSASELARSHPGRVSIAYKAIGSLILIQGVSSSFEPSLEEMPQKLFCPIIVGNFHMRNGIDSS